MSDFIIQNPKPSILLFAIRSIGYSFEMAVADIIDNSISAQADKIKIYSEALDSPYFCVLDNGVGMNEAELKNAFLLGSERIGKDEFDLGRFGLGLKSASLSQCIKFTVATKQGDNLLAMVFDVEEICRTQEWRLTVLSPQEYDKIPEIDRLKKLSHGTLVVWQNFDRIENSTKTFETTFRRHVDKAKSHVEYVFHRFYNDIKIYFNEVRIERRDPFLKESYGRGQEGRAEKIPLEKGVITIRPYVLPYSNSLSNEERALLGNPRSLYDEQGLYLYRNRRLIAWGSWFRIEVRSEFHKLARVQIDIPSALDDIWSLDVKKSSAKIPDIIRNQVRISINDSTTRSKGTLRHPGTREIGTQYNVWERRSLPAQRAVTYAINRDNPILKTLQSRLESVELNLLENFIKQVEAFLPKTNIHHDECMEVSITNACKQNSNELEIELIELIKSLTDSNRDRRFLLRTFLTSQKYESLKSKSDSILRRLENE